jgi:hypothetical protein
VFLYDESGVDGKMFQSGHDAYGHFIVVPDLQKGIRCKVCQNILMAARQYWGYWRQECMCGHVLFDVGWLLRRGGDVF